MVGIETSCDPTRLQKVIAVSRVVMKGFYGLTPEDREDILMDVMYRFEVDEGKYPVSVYASFCRNKVIGFLGKKTAQKRCASTVVDGNRVFLEDVSLDLTLGEEDDVAFGDLLPTTDDGFARSELLTQVEMSAPDLRPLVERVLQGDKLSRTEKGILRRRISKEQIN